ncbi:hypothetical protein F3J45_00720 [Pantoea sp. Ap-967]|uniref:hypothetical protein n=1 Tax=Pantoea sp. Ap-967 TaxID=2608362 RepID=UPI001422ADE3|nr:hypothetical protein [Pantoea sp. Ap-967]NIE72988.1 hypothetical protein [Pantoea sp. Ap-967]
MSQPDNLSLEIYALKAIVLGLINVLQDDSKALEQARKAALASISIGTKEDRELVENHVSIALSPRFHKSSEKTNA